MKNLDHLSASQIIRYGNLRERARLDCQTLRAELRRAPRRARAEIILRLDEALARFKRYGGDPSDTAEIDTVTTWRGRAPKPKPVPPLFRELFDPESVR